MMKSVVITLTALIILLLNSCKLNSVNEEDCFILDIDRYGVEKEKSINYYLNGNIKSTGYVSVDKEGHKSNLKVGRWKEYHINGKLKSEGEYNVEHYVQCCFGGPCAIFYSYKIGLWNYFSLDEILETYGEYEIKKMYIETSCEGGDSINVGLVDSDWIIKGKPIDFNLLKAEKKEYESIESPFDAGCYIPDSLYLKMDYFESSDECNLDDFLELITTRESIQNNENIRDSISDVLIEYYNCVDPKFKELDYSGREHRGSDISVVKEYLVDLNNDGNDEIVLFIGHNYSFPFMHVYHKVKGEWNKIFHSRYYLHNEYPVLKIIESSRKKILRVGGFMYKGSGSWLFNYEYLEFVDSKLLKILEMPGYANDGLSFDYLNTRIKMVYDTLIDNNFRFRYDYDLEGSYIFNREVHNDLSLMKDIDLVNNGTLLINYQWDNNGNLKSENQIDFSKILLNVDNDACQLHVWEDFFPNIEKSKREILSILLQDSTCID